MFGFKLTSPAFKDGSRLPVKYTIDGDKVSPPLKWKGAPGETKSFALVALDLDVPKEMGGFFCHWMVYDIAASVRELPEGASERLPAGAKQLPNTYAQFGMAGIPMARYGPPWPPTPDHRYQFTLYTLRVATLGLAANANYQDFKRAVEANAIKSAQLIGVYGPAKTPMPKQ